MGCPPGIKGFCFLPVFFSIFFLELECIRVLQKFNILGEVKPMRTTIELSNDRRSSLHSLAAQRGLRGYSKLIEEAVDLYIQEKTNSKSKVEHL